MPKSTYQYTILATLLLPLITNAQSTSLQNILTNVFEFLLGVLVPFLFGLGVLFFIFNAIRYFVIGGSNEDDQKKAKTLAIYSVAAFVFLIIFYGLVNFLSESIGLGGNPTPTPDYLNRPGSNPVFETDPCDPSTFNAELCPGGV